MGVPLANEMVSSSAHTHHMRTRSRVSPATAVAVTQNALMAFFLGHSGVCSLTQNVFCRKMCHQGKSDLGFALARPLLSATLINIQMTQQPIIMRHNLNLVPSTTSLETGSLRTMTTAFDSKTSFPFLKKTNTTSMPLSVITRPMLTTMTKEKTTPTARRPRGRSSISHSQTFVTF